MLGVLVCNAGYIAGRFLPHLLIEAILRQKLIELAALTISAIAVLYAIASPIWTTDQLSKRIDSLQEQVTKIQPYCIRK